MTLSEFLSQWHDTNPSVPVYTSGSTGKPKLIMADKARMAASARMTCKALGLNPGDTALVCLPMDYIAGKMMVVRCDVCNLTMVYVPPSGHPLDSVDSHIDFAAMVPMQVCNSLSDPTQYSRLRSIRNLLIGGGAIDSGTEAVLRTFPHAVWSSYGMTETLSHIALRRLDGSAYSEWYEPLPGISVSLDGGGFFYPNPLESMGQHQRQPWFGCACCPSNICRFIPSLPGYVYAVKDRNVYVNLFLSNSSTLKVAGKDVALTQATEYPYDGDVRLTINKNSAGQFALKIRVPGWVKNKPVPSDLYSYSDNKRLGYYISVNGTEIGADNGCITEDGYFTITRK